MKTIKITLYQFSELTHVAQLKAIDAFNEDAHAMDFFGEVENPFINYTEKGEYVPHFQYLLTLFNN